MPISPEDQKKINNADYRFHQMNLGKIISDAIDNAVELALKLDQDTGVTDADYSSLVED